MAATVEQKVAVRSPVHALPGTTLDPRPAPAPARVPYPLSGPGPLRIVEEVEGTVDAQIRSEEEEVTAEGEAPLLAVSATALPIAPEPIVLALVHPSVVEATTLLLPDGALPVILVEESLADVGLRGLGQEATLCAPVDHVRGPSLLALDRVLCPTPRSIAGVGAELVLSVVDAEAQAEMTSGIVAQGHLGRGRLNPLVLLASNCYSLLSPILHL